MPLCQVKYAEDSDSNYCEDRYMKESAVKVRVEKMLSMLDNVASQRVIQRALCHFEREEIWL